MKLAVLALLVIHGLIHLLGFVKAFGLAEVRQLSGVTLLALPSSFDRVLGALWLLACLAMLAAGAALSLRPAMFWPVGALAVALSQLLIVNAWPDAKAGTLANALVALAVLVSWADTRFDAGTREALRELHAAVPAAPGPLVTEARLASLPEPVQRWLRRAGVPGRPMTRTARLHQTGLMRTSAGQSGMPTTAEQWFRIDEPGFVWDAHVRMHGLPIRGRDSYLAGRGRMRIEALALWPIVDGQGEQIDQGTLLRYLAEVMWFPSAALHPSLRWEAVDDTHAAVTTSHRGVSARAVVAIDAEGRVTGIEARRYMGTGKDATLERWVGECDAWQRLGDGVEIPTRGRVVWKLASGDLPYYEWQITRIEYDAAR